MAAPQLVYDVGMHDGKDTAYYLHRGYRVLAIEANPVLAARGRSRFGDALRSGQLEILEVGIAESEGRAEFYISAEDIWSSFDPDHASKNGREATPIDVKCRTFGSVLDEFGIPHYMKIDIEGSDPLCVHALPGREPPVFLSTEVNSDDLSEIDVLSGCGYSHFKLIRQNDLTTVGTGNVKRVAWVQKLRRGNDPLTIAVRIGRRLARERHSRRCGWRFDFGSSGPFGLDTRGRSEGAQATRVVWQHLQREQQGHSGPLQDSWFDVHAGLKAF